MLSHSIVHFFIRLGCGGTQQAAQPPPSRSQSQSQSQPVLLQYSSNGGITWATLETMDFGGGRGDSGRAARHVMLELPPGTRANATRLRWWQPSLRGSFHQAWAIDQVSQNASHSCNPRKIMILVTDLVTLCHQIITSEVRFFSGVDEL